MLLAEFFREQHDSQPGRAHEAEFAQVEGDLLRAIRTQAQQHGFEFGGGREIELARQDEPVAAVADDVLYVLLIRSQGNFRDDPGRVVFVASYLLAARLPSSIPLLAATLPIATPLWKQSAGCCSAATASSSAKC